MPTVAVLIADGTEEMEAVIITDTLRRADLDVALVGLKSRDVSCSRKVKIRADTTLSDTDLSSFDAIVLPGGMDGTHAFMANPHLIEAITMQASSGKLLCAICAAPLVLQAAGLTASKRVTCHPGVAAQLTTGELTRNRVERDGNIITSQGPGTAFEFALEIIKDLKGAETANLVRSGLVL